MKVFLVNLDKAKQRLQKADAQLKRLGIDYERISAVYGKEMPEDEFNRSVNRFRWWCSVGWNVVAGPVGCALSHYTAYRKMIADDLPFCCVFEDDVVVRDELPVVLKYIEENIEPEKPQVILLHDHKEQCAMSVTLLRDTAIKSEDVCASSQVAVGEICTSHIAHSTFLEPAAGDDCAEGYVITRVAAERLLMANFPLKIPVDEWGRFVRLGLIELYHARPTVCDQDKSFESDVQPPGTRMVNDLQWYSLIVHKCKRLAGKSIDSFLMFFERRHYKNRYARRIEKKGNGND